MSRKMTSGKFSSPSELRAAVYGYYDERKQSINQIAAACGVAPGTVTGIIAGRTESKLVERVRDMEFRAQLPELPAGEITDEYYAWLYAGIHDRPREA